MGNHRKKLIVFGPRGKMLELSPNCIIDIFKTVYANEVERISVSELRAGMIVIGLGKVESVVEVGHEA